MFDILLDALIDTAKDSLLILPILFLAYLAMEAMESATDEKLEKLLKRAGRFGPLVGAIFGIIPECGFSAAAGGFFSGGVISAGTVIAVFLSTSDELIPIFLSDGREHLHTLLIVLAAKIVWAILIGYTVDFFWNKRHKPDASKIHNLCEKDHCGCEDEEHGNIFRSALIHTLKIMVWIVITSVVLNCAIALIGEETLGAFISGLPVVGELAAGLIGLIPNCAASVLLAELFLKGIITSGTMFSGLLVSAGTGLLVLTRMNKNKKDTLILVSILYVAGVLGGLVFGLIF